MPHPTFPASEEFDALLADWRAAFNTREVGAIAALFAEDAMFQGLTPNLLVGRGAIAEYYGNVPAGVEVEVQAVKAVYPVDGLMAGFATVVFSLPEPDTLRPVRVSILAARGARGWEIRLYHASVTA